MLDDSISVTVRIRKGLNRLPQLTFKHRPRTSTLADNLIDGKGGERTMAGGKRTKFDSFFSKLTDFIPSEQRRFLAVESIPPYWIVLFHSSRGKQGPRNIMH